MRWMLLLVLAGCPGTPPPACITVDASCAAGYQPTFHNVYQNTLVPDCSMTSACHSESGHQANLSFGGDEASAYAALMANSSIDPSRARVVAGNAACSLLIVRTDSPGTDYQMPKGAALTEPESCALIQWVQAGAMP
ncbi:MAG: hypothetical protein ABI591_08835 [Kofleriaceae bacterium]